MNLPKLAPLATQGGDYSIKWDESGTEHRTYSWRTYCAECKSGFSSSEKEEAEKMWWDHIRSQHPSAWAVYADRQRPYI